ncbi:Golgi apparatus protein 1 isoform X2 [Lingula anatina]|uniref:Golgi apparatus protein 1 isoform X2 n=1 Tax=Lingula anatina TaxID=7574 RepID=A0A1S3JEH6_LINAN|nr:Golgi apparatus protein 1 isoform X2 [Lingula anatina]|eukprot:XP_013408738.1 Golgi apparatus protein 1 isoform X2 [Lingula anatina]
MADHRRVLPIFAVFLLLHCVWGEGKINQNALPNENSNSQQEMALERQKRIETRGNGQFANAINMQQQPRQPAGAVPQVPAGGQGQGNMQRQGNQIGGGGLAFKQNPAVDYKSPNRSPGSFQQQQQAAHPTPPMKLAENPDCKEEIKHYCSHNLANSMSNNFAVLDCLQNDLKENQQLTPKCQHVVYDYKRQLTTDVRFDSAAFEVCKDPLSKLPECNKLQQGGGEIIPCLIENMENITNQNCQLFLKKMASLIFSDYRLIKNFVERCGNDISRFKCGRSEDDRDDSPHNQGRTIKCLERHYSELDEGCNQQIMRVAELQSDDYHMDRPLYFACKDDREKFCRDVKAGHGRIFKCLYKHKFERTMSAECQEMVTLRQKLVHADYKVGHALAEGCAKDIKMFKCAKHARDHQNQPGRLSEILLCLENERKKGKKVSAECQSEMNNWRRSLMEDYQLTPEVAKDCSTEVTQYCDGGTERGGKTLHCLMDLARPRERQFDKQPRISEQCLRALEGLIKVADAAEDIRVDPSVMQACQPVASVLCKDVKPGDANVMACLMDKMESDKMTDECEERLVEIQYFVARDFNLDSRLHKLCHKDAVKHCHASENWYDPDTEGPSNGPLILPCLYGRIMHHENDPHMQISRQCALEVKRVMHQRALNVDLEPRIEEPCMADLATYCSQETEKGAEVECLQDNYDSLSDECQEAVGNFTEDEDADIELDKILMKACMPMLRTFCQKEMEDDRDTGEVMECLIKQKHSPQMDLKCAAGIEHHQLITLKDYRFSHKFKEACKADVMKLCKNAKSKSQVVVCLSEHMRNDTLLDKVQRLSAKCLSQLKFELLQRSESIKLDPDLLQSCQEDIDHFCPDKNAGNAEVTECLRKKNPKKLSSSCRSMLFKREMVMERNPSVDFGFMTYCKSMVKHYCQDEEPSNYLTCLKRHKNEDNFDQKCRRKISDRQIEQNRDYRLNPALKSACTMDIPKFCKAVLQNKKSKDEDFEGEVINCLKTPYRKGRLSKNCEDQIGQIIRSAALDYRQDPVLARACEKELKAYCSEEVERVQNGQGGKGEVEECLKNLVKQNKIKPKSDCSNEVARILVEGKTDVHLDPILHQACSADLRHYCDGIEPGEGRLMSCLLTALDDRTIRLTKHCRILLQQRVDLWEYAAKIAPPETAADLWDQVMGSPSRNHFLLIIFAVISVMFIGGLCCGRVTKRVTAQAKNK